MQTHLTEGNRIRIGLLGSKGRMGVSVIHLLKTEFGAVASLNAEVDASDSFDALFSTDVVIEFSRAEAAQEMIKKALENPRPLPVFLFGSTGWSSDGSSMLESLAKQTLVLHSSNFSVGVNILSEILAQWSPVLEGFGFQPAIQDVHHRHKKDSPSGTALTLAKKIRPESPGSVQIQSVRAGEVIGDHVVSFYGQSEVIEFGHFAQDRKIFSRGAIQVAIWLAKQRQNSTVKTGLLTMKDYFKALLKETTRYE